MKRSQLEKQKEAEERANLRSKRSHQDQIKVLDNLFGKNVGAAKERAKLKSLIENPPAKNENSDAKKKRKFKSKNNVESED